MLERRDFVLVRSKPWTCNRSLRMLTSMNIALYPQGPFGEILLGGSLR